MFRAQLLETTCVLAFVEINAEGFVAGLHEPWRAVAGI